MNYLRCRGIQLWGERERKKKRKLVDSIKERHALFKITRFADKGAQRHRGEKL